MRSPSQKVEEMIYRFKSIWFQRPWSFYSTTGLLCRTWGRSCVWVIYLWGDLREKDRGTRGSLRKKKKKEEKAIGGDFVEVTAMGPLDLFLSRTFSTTYICLSEFFYKEQTSGHIYPSALMPLCLRALPGHYEPCTSRNAFVPKEWTVTWFWNIRETSE